MQYAVQATNVKKTYNDLQILKGIDLQIPTGSICGITGKSGAGKSTLLHILGTLDSPDSGEVLILGKAPFQLNSKALAKFRNAHIGFIFQFHHLLPELNVIENICVPAWIKHTPDKEAREQATQLAAHLGLSHRLKHTPRELSGGEQQRVAVARALINQPGIILADEPTGNLDTQHSQELHALFLQLREMYQLTFIIVTHNKDLTSICDLVMHMEDGLLQPVKQSL